MTSEEREILFFGPKDVGSAEVEISAIRFPGDPCSVWLCLRDDSNGQAVSINVDPVQAREIAEAMTKAADAAERGEPA